MRKIAISILITLPVLLTCLTGCHKNYDQTTTDKITIPVYGASTDESKLGLSQHRVNEDADNNYENLILINKDNKIPENFSPDLSEIIDGFQFDSKAAPYLLNMIQDAKKDGINLFIVSSYRSLEKQTKNFNNKIDQLKSSGLSDEEAYKLTCKYIAPPGFSEHSVGLAVDLNSLEEIFEQTIEFNWLQTHAADYGFILRYPKNKEDITKIAYEPWHYRYVGQKHSKKIMENNLTLEEYLENMR